MVEYFLTTYKDDSNGHIYYFPGMDESGHALTRMSFLTSPGDYRYTRHTDGGIDYILLSDVKTVKCRVQNIATREVEDIELNL
jgi:hypothetical protein